MCIRDRSYAKTFGLLGFRESKEEVFAKSKALPKVLSKVSPKVLPKGTSLRDLPTEHKTVSHVSTDCATA